MNKIETRTVFTPSGCSYETHYEDFYEADHEARICVRGVAVFIRLGGGGVAVLMISSGRRRGSIGVIHMAARGGYAMSDGCGERSTIYE